MTHNQCQNHGKFYVGKFDVYKGLDHRGTITMKGEIKTLYLQEGNLFGVIKVDEVIDKHCGLVRYEGLDVVRKIQLTGEMVDLLHGRVTAAFV